MWLQSGVRVDRRQSKSDASVPAQFTSSIRIGRVPGPVVWATAPPSKPSSRHVTPAAGVSVSGRPKLKMVHPSIQTVPHCPPIRTSRRPLEPPVEPSEATSRMFDPPVSVTSKCRKDPARTWPMMTPHSRICAGWLHVLVASRLMRLGRPCADPTRMKCSTTG